MTSELFAAAGLGRSPRSLGIAAVFLALLLPATAAATQKPTIHERAWADYEKAQAEIRQRECEKPLGEFKRLDLSPWPEHVRHLDDPPESQEAMAEVFLNLAACYNRIGQFTDSRDCARAAVDLAQNPTQRTAAQNELGLSTLGYCSTKCPVSKSEAFPPAIRERLEEAEAAFNKVLELTGGRENAARVSLGQLLVLQGRYEEAEAALAGYLEREPEGERAARARTAMQCAALRPISGQALQALKTRGELELPVKVFSPKAQYTDEARRARLNGVVLLEVTIDKAGAVRCVRVIKGLPMGLTESAIETISRWRFEPATLEGEPVAVVSIPMVTFRLQ